MTHQSIYRVLCDAPHCSASGVVEKLTEVPTGWVRLDSRSHLDDKPPPVIGRGRHRRTVPSWDVRAAGFALTLCPEHPAAFGDHRPQTAGGEAKRGEQRVRVGCACDWPGTSTRHEFIVGRKPSSTVEFAWVQHLPADLHWYATRKAAS